MPRPKKVKNVSFEPEVTYFKPRGVPLKNLEEIELTIDELETLRLSNIEKMSQKDAAEIMNVHQSTFQRTLSRANEKIANALVFGKAIKINGGNYKMEEININIKGRMGGPKSAGPIGKCICISCNYEQEHQTGVPCNELKCPQCGKNMSRK